MRLSKNECINLYKKYKNECDIIYSDISCDSSEIHKMNISNLLIYLKKIKNLYIKSGKCYKYRIEYKMQCIKEENRDSNHDYAIKKSLKYHKFCQKKLISVEKRLNELTYNLNKSQQLLNYINKMS